MSTRYVVLPLVWVVGLMACAEYVGTTDDADGGDASTPRDGEKSAVEGGAAADGSSQVEAGASSSSGASGSSSSGGASYVLSAAEQTMFDTINDVRKNLAPGASPPLNPVLWDPSIGLDLRQWAAGCSSQTPPLQGGTSTVYGPIDQLMTVQELLQFLVDSRQYYNLATNQCSAGPSQCEGYTNMVQRTVSRIACVFSDTVCPAPMPEGGDNVPWRNWACTFAPLPEPSARPY